MVKKVLAFPVLIVQVVFGTFFLIFFPILMVYSWLRFLLKRLLNLKPTIVYTPLGMPLPLMAAQSIRTQGYLADLVCFDVSPYFKSLNFDFVLSRRRNLSRLNFLTDYLLLFYWAILKYDLFEFPFSGGLLMYSHFRTWEYVLLKLCAKKIAVYGYGSDCKVLSDIRKEAKELGIKYNTAMDRNEATETSSEKTILANVKRGQKFADTIIVGGDLVHLGPKSIMLPVAIDISLWPYQKPNKNKIITLIHSTNHRSHKGTRFIIEIVQSLKKKLPIKLLIVEGKSLNYCRRVYPRGDIFITDVITGWHGFTLIEAMATGRPVISYLRKDFLKKNWYYARFNPAVSADPDKLAQAITNLVNKRKLREKLGQSGRKYVEKFHTFDFGGQARAVIYDSIWQGKKINQTLFEWSLRSGKII